MEDVEREKGLVKWQLEQALSRRGLAQSRLNGAAQQLESLAKSLREDPSELALSFSPLVLEELRSMLNAYTNCQHEVREHVKTLETLRVPKSEIEALLQGK